MRRHRVGAQDLGRGRYRGAASRRKLPAPVAGDRISNNGRSLLEQAEQAGLSPQFGCRMGICHTCTCRKTAGTVRNLVSGEVSSAEEEDIQICVSVPAGDVELDL